MGNANFTKGFFPEVGDVERVVVVDLSAYCCAKLNRLHQQDVLLSSFLPPWRDKEQSLFFLLSALTLKMPLSATSLNLALSLSSHHFRMTKMWIGRSEEQTIHGLTVFHGSLTLSLYRLVFVLRYNFDTI